MLASVPVGCQRSYSFLKHVIDFFTLLQHPIFIVLRSMSFLQTGFPPKASALGHQKRRPLHVRCRLTAVLLIIDNAILYSEEAPGKRNPRTSISLERTGLVSFAAALSSHSTSSSLVSGQIMTAKVRVTRSEHFEIYSEHSRISQMQVKNTGWGTSLGDFESAIGVMKRS